MKDRSNTYQKVFFIVLWVLCTFGFVADEIIPPLDQIRSPIFLLCDLTIAMLGICVIRKWQDLALSATLLLLAFFSTYFINGLSLPFFLNGLREFVGLMFVMPLLRYFLEEEGRRKRFERAFDHNLYLFLFVQAFCLIFQFLKYGAGDHGGGSFGNWYSGQVSTLIYLCSFYLLNKQIDRDNFLKSLYDNKSLILLLAPTFLNETKISIVYLLLYFILLLPIDRRLVVRMTLFAPVVVIFVWMGVNIYSASTRNSEDTNKFSIEYISEYLLLEEVEHAKDDAEWNMDSNNGVADVPRMTKLLYLPILDEENPGHILTGFGVGQFKGGTSMEVSEFAEEYDWLLMGSIPYVFHLYIQLGVLGVVWFLAFVVNLFMAPITDGRRWTRNWNICLFALIVITILLIYIDILRKVEFCMIFFAIVCFSWQPEAEQVEIES